jgi:hypothetical protein
MAAVKLRFFCPVHKGPLSTNVEEAGDLASRWSEELRLSCPHCNGEHTFVLREAYIVEPEKDPT